MVSSSNVRFLLLFSLFYIAHFSSFFVKHSYYFFSPIPIPMGHGGGGGGGHHYHSTKIIPIYVPQQSHPGRHVINVHGGYGGQGGHGGYGN